jgi:TolB-like protein
LSHAGQIVTHQHLKPELWGDVHVTEDSVPKCMSSLREHLQPDDCIQTVYKRGYRLSAEVHKIESASAQGLPRLAIVPFTTGFNVAAHLGAAVAEETIARLTAEPLAPARVLARDSVFTLAARGLSAQQVGEALKADLVLTGTIRALPTHFRLRAEMIRVADDTQIWIEDVLVPLGRISGLETELAQRLLVSLNGGGLAISASSAKEAADESDPIRREAYELFLRGHDEWQTPQRHRMQDGTRHLRRAIELNPSLVSAHIDLAHACITQGFYGFLSPALAAEQVRLAVAAIPPSIEGAEAILPAIGWIKFHVDHDLTGAIRAFETCSHLSHDTAVTRLRTMFALSRHRFDEAIAISTAALNSDPFSPWLNARLAWAYHLSGDAIRSVEQIERALEFFPYHQGACLYGTILLAFNGNADRAATIAENLERKSPYFDLATAVHGYALACAGKREEARMILERLQWLSRERFVLSSFTPALCVALGDMDGAMAELSAAAEARCPWFFQMLADPRLKPLRGRADFVKLEKILERMETTAEKHLSHEN